MSLGEIKLIAIVKWILHVSDFLRLFMISFKYSLIFFKFNSSIDRVFLSPLLSYSIVTSEVTYSYWFIIIILFFFMLKRVLNISIYSVFNCYIFFFQSKMISNVLNCDVVYFFFNLKRFLASLMILSSIFYLFQALNFHHYVLWRKIN